MRRPLLLTLVLALVRRPGRRPRDGGGRPGQSVTFEAPRELVYEPEKRAEAFSTLESLGVHSLRIVLYWKTVAPVARQPDPSGLRRDRPRGLPLGRLRRRHRRGARAGAGTSC